MLAAARTEIRSGQYLTGVLRCGNPLHPKTRNSEHMPGADASPAIDRLTAFNCTPALSLGLVAGSGWDDLQAAFVRDRRIPDHVRICLCLAARDCTLPCCCSGGSDHESAPLDGDFACSVERSACKSRSCISRWSASVASRTSAIAFVTCCSSNGEELATDAN